MLPTGEFLSPMTILKEIVTAFKEKIALTFKGHKTSGKTEAKTFVHFVSFIKL